MAVQAGMATGRLIILIGAGMTGTMIMKNGGSLKDFIKDIGKVFTKHLSEEEKQGGGGELSKLNSQIQRLSSELSKMASSRSITVVNGGGGQSSNIGTYIVPGVFVGVIGYGYMWWKGYTFTDLMYVTRKNMANAVESVTKQLEQVSSAVAATKRHLSSRIDNVSKTLDENVAVQHLIKNEVYEIRGDVARVGGEIGTVQDMIEGLNSQLDVVQNNQNLTNQGIVLLCQFARRFEDAKQLQGPAVPLTLQNGDSIPAISEKLTPLPTKSRIDRSSSLVSPATGLKELQSISDALSSEAPRSSIYRTITSNLSFSRAQKSA